MPKIEPRLVEICQVDNTHMHGGRIKLCMAWGVILMRTQKMTLTTHVI
jgi:nitrogen fixation protein